MDALGITWFLAGVASLLLVALVAATVVGRTRRELGTQEAGDIWKRAYHLAAELSGNRSVEANEPRLIELIGTSPDRLTVLNAVAVAIRQDPHDVPPALHSAIQRSSAAAFLRPRLAKPDDRDTTIEALELIEVLRIVDLLGDVALLTSHREPTVVRAACDALVELDPSIGLGVLIGLVDVHDSWVLDALGRATDRLNSRGDDLVPLAQGQWRHAPMLATRALVESATFDRATVNDAVNTLIAALDDPSPARRLAAVTALAASVDHAGAQLALAGALGAPERMTRFAVAAALSDTVNGRRILRRVADDRFSSDPGSSDAARIAAEILWFDDDRQDGLQSVAS